MQITSWHGLELTIELTKSEKICRKTFLSILIFAYLAPKKHISNLNYWCETWKKTLEKNVNNVVDRLLSLLDLSLFSQPLKRRKSVRYHHTIEEDKKKRRNCHRKIEKSEIGNWRRELRIEEWITWCIKRQGIFYVRLEEMRSEAAMDVMSLSILVL